MTGYLIFGGWLYVNVGAFLLSFYDADFSTPRERVRAWAFWPMHFFTKKRWRR